VSLVVCASLWCAHQGRQGCAHARPSSLSLSLTHTHTRHRAHIAHAPPSHLWAVLVARRIPAPVEVGAHSVCAQVAPACVRVCVCVCVEASVCRLAACLRCGACHDTRLTNSNTHLKPHALP
jgi:hypothetical protein